MTKRFPRLQLPDGATGRPAVTGAQHRQQAGVADNPMNMNGPNPVPATNLRARGATSGADHAANVAGPSVTVVEPKKSRAFLSLGRNKASPARLVKLNEILSPAQKTLITEWGWGGMMMVKASEMPVDLSMWVLACFGPIRSELAIPGRGTIPVDAASYNKVFGLPNEGLPVRYEMETEPIASMNEEYNIQGGSAPGFKQWRKMIQEMGGAADMKFLRAYCAAVMSCFISPSTSANISPRSYPSLIDLNILYLDSLDVDEHVPSIEECPIRAAAWDDKLIQVVMRKDMKSSGEFGKMKLKDGVGVTIRDGLFVGMTRLEEFVSSRLPRNFPCQKKRKLVVMIGELCTDISNRLGTFVQQVGDLEQAEDSSKGVCGRVMKRQRPEPSVVVDEDDDDDADDEDYNADGDEDDEDNEDGDDEDDEDDEDGDNEDGASKEHPSNEQHNEDDGFEDRGAHFENTPRRSARLGNMNTNQTVGAENTPVPGLSPFSDIRGFASSGGEDIDMTNNQAPQFFDITEKIYPNSIFMEEIARSQRVSPATTPPLDQFRRDTAQLQLIKRLFHLQELQQVQEQQPTTQVQHRNLLRSQLMLLHKQKFQQQLLSFVLLHAGTRILQHLLLRLLLVKDRRRTVSPRNHQVQRVKLAHLRDLRILDGRRVVTTPSFNLGFDSPPKNQEQSPIVAASAGITPTSLRSLGSPIFDEYEDVWSLEMEEEAIALCTKVEMEKGYLRVEADTMGVGHQSEAELQTPTPVANRVTRSKDASGSNSDAAPVELCERRIIRPAACYKSPYIDFSNKNTYACSADVKEVYDLVTSCAKRNGRGQHKDNTPIIVNFEKFFVSQQELANSMMPCAELDNTVFELGLESIMLRKDKDDKKVVMPLRFMTLLLEYGWKHKDLKKYFAKKDAHLDKKDLVLLPVLENMSEDPTVKVNHYWLLVLNIKDRRFEVLDSMRTINDKKTGPACEESSGSNNISME
ncbi:hypothetical protein ACQ4PT_016499 [Festuca glaucescens]